MTLELLSGENKNKFENAKTFFMEGLSSNNLNIKLAVEKFSSNDEIVKTAIEHSFRIFVLQNIKQMPIDEMKKILDLSILASQKKLCLPTTPIFLISDMLSSLTIDKCSEIFCYLEDSSNVWKSELFYSSVKNYLLRMCNDLLKRLSKSQNTVFSGRIHLFLAKLFPLNEKSGLNLMSHFSDNFTRFTTNPETFEEAINKNRTDSSMEIDDCLGQDSKLSTHSMPIDFNLYMKFWSLQEFFSKPNICYDKVSWKTFTNNAGEVFEALKSYKLDDLKEDNSSKNAPKVDDDEMNLYFSKYLTSEKLLDLQLNDSNFRRQILTQFLILFQYLNADVKFKTNGQVLNEEQLSWIKSANKRVNELLKETPPMGPRFGVNVKHILGREDIWNKWKNEGCPNYVKEKRPAATAGKTPTKRAKLTTSDFITKSPTKATSTSSSSSSLSYTNNENVSVIAKLCNINHANLEACKDPNRQFLPSIKEFFEEAIDQMDPANQVEKNYWLINQTDWAWKALRLLAKRSTHYFMQNQSVKPVSEYLEATCTKLGKEFANEQARNEQHAAQAQKQQEQQNQQQNQPQQQSTQQQQQQQVQQNQDCAEDPDPELQSTNENDQDADLSQSNQQNEQVTIKEEKQLMNDSIQNDNLNEMVDSAQQVSCDDDEASQLNEEPDAPTKANNHDDTPTPKMDLDNDNSEEDTKPPSNLVLAPVSAAVSSSSETNVHTINKLIDHDLIEFVSNGMDETSLDVVKQLAQNLNINLDNLTAIAADSDVRSACRKLLQTWTETDDRKDLVDVLINELKKVGKDDLAASLENKVKDTQV